MPTIGVSIEVPDPCGRALQDYRLSLGDESARHIPTHITLVPPMEVPRSGLEEVHQHLTEAARRHDAFVVHLRGTGSFRPVSPVVFVNVVRGISECELLAKDVGQGPLYFQSEFPYHPHVTIAHHLPDATLDRAFAEQAGFECEFDVAGFWLYVFDQGDGWIKTEEYLLA